MLKLLKLYSLNSVTCHPLTRSVIRDPSANISLHLYTSQQDRAYIYVVVYNNSWSTTHVTTLVSNVNVPAHVTVNSIIKKIKKMSTSCCIHQQLMLHQVVGFWVWHVVLHLLKMAQTASSVVSSIFADIEKYICGQWFHLFKLLSLYNLAKYLILLIIFSTTKSVLSK